MLAMVLERPGEPLTAQHVPDPRPGDGELLIEVTACAVCRTDLHIADGELPAPGLPLIPGHQVVGTVTEHGAGVTDPPTGTRVGLPWLGGTCGSCRFCTSARENLCDQPVFTGLSRDGGYAELVTAGRDYVFALGAGPPERLAPLLCGGMIGYRAYRMARAGLDAAATTGRAPALALYGYGSSARLLMPLARADGCRVFVHTRPGDAARQQQARAAGADWAGGSDAAPPEPAAAAIIFAPVGALVPAALAAVDKGGQVVCAGIHMSDIPRFPYADLWQERVVRSVANLTRADGRELLRRAGELELHAEARCFRLRDANAALSAVRDGELDGSAVLLTA